MILGYNDTFMDLYNFEGTRLTASDDDIIIVVRVVSDDGDLGYLLACARMWLANPNFVQSTRSYVGQFSWPVLLYVLKGFRLILANLALQVQLSKAIVWNSVTPFLTSDFELALLSIAVQVSRHKRYQLLHYNYTYHTYVTSRNVPVLKSRRNYSGLPCIESVCSQALVMELHSNFWGFINLPNTANNEWKRENKHQIRIILPSLPPLRLNDNRYINIIIIPCKRFSRIKFKKKLRLHYLNLLVLERILLKKIKKEILKQILSEFVAF